MQEMDKTVRIHLFIFFTRHCLVFGAIFACMLANSCSPWAHNRVSLSHLNVLQGGTTASRVRKLMEEAGGTNNTMTKMKCTIRVDQAIQFTMKMAEILARISRAPGPMVV